MRLLIAGLGSVGRRHLRNLRTLGVQDILLYRTGRATLPDAELAGYPVFTELSQALAQKPDAVIVANPTALHLDVAIPAAAAGCHLLLEKPVADSLDRVAELREAAARSGARILVGFQFRFHPALQRAAQLIASGELGQPLTFHAYYGEYLPNWHPWEDYRRGYAARADLGGGAIGTLCHPLDYVPWLLGPVDTVSCLSGHVSPLEVDVEDIAEIGLRLTGGAIGSVHVNYVQRPAVNRLEIVGTKGTLRWDLADGILHALRMPAPFGTYSAQPAPPDATDFAPPAGFDRNVMFLDQMRHFLAVVRGETEPACTLEDGIRALALALAARESAAGARAVRLAPGGPR